MSTNNKYEEAFLANATNLDAITKSNGKIYDCALRIIQNNDTDDTLELIGYITKFGTDQDHRKKNIAISLKDSLFMLYGNRGIEEIYHTKKAAISEEENTKTIDQLLQELNELIGLEKVKKTVNDLTKRFKKSAKVMDLPIQIGLCIWPSLEIQALVKPQ